MRMGYISLLSAALLFWVLISATPARADQVCYAAKPRAQVIVLHGGSFILGSSAMTSDSCARFARAGINAFNLDYPLGDLEAAESYLLSRAQELRASRLPLFAYGESAGGGLSALLAARSRVDAAFAWAPVSDLLAWQGESLPGFVNWQPFRSADPSLLRRLSAASWASPFSAPLMVVHGRADLHVPFAQSLRLKAVYPRMRLKPARGGHLQYEQSYLKATSSALSFFNGRLRLTGRK